MKIFYNRPFIVPRWIILLADTCIATFSFILSYFILNEFRFNELVRGHFFIYAGLFAATSMTIFYLMRIYKGLIRYSNTKDMFRIFSAVLIVSLVYPVVSELIARRMYAIPALDMPPLLVLNWSQTVSLSYAL